MKALLAFCCFCLAAAAQDNVPVPDLAGYVTRVASASDFDVNGWRILCGPQTNTALVPQRPSPRRVYHPGCPQQPPRIGLAVAVWGTRDKAQFSIAATQLDLGPIPFEKVSSYGIVEAILARSPQALTLRADGYTIRIPASAHLTFRKSLRSLADITTNVWLDYKGEQQTDGTILAREARFRPNLPNPKAEKTRARTDYDPSKVTKAGNAAVEILIGVNAMKIPAWPDAAIQARVAAVGEKLIPAYQRQLPDSDETKIDFRFYVTTGDRWLSNMVALPSGVILVPHRMVERMQNDSQLAAILAESMAVEMEAQDDRMMAGIRPTKKQLAGALAEDAGIYAGEAMVPAVGLAVLGDTAFGLTSATRTLEKQLQQSARVSLSLMRDAGYDPAEAPIAWWQLSDKKGKPLAGTDLPLEAAWLYRDLSATWSLAPPSPAPEADLAAH